jgi:D-alanyl-D-alanine carboxypeptidase/D-alanyl-D-alanine-endopeptidase (penicillin-binding protein 4)
MSDSRVQRAKSSAVVLDAVTGERLYSRNGIVPRIPASNTKILTAAAALETLGRTSPSTPTCTAGTRWSAAYWTGGST